MDIVVQFAHSASTKYFNISPASRSSDSDAEMLMDQFIATCGEAAGEGSVTQKPENRIRKLLRLICNQNMLPVNYGDSLCTESCRNKWNITSSGFKDLEPGIQTQT